MSISGNNILTSSMSLFGLDPASVQVLFEEHRGEIDAFFKQGSADAAKNANYQMGAILSAIAHYTKNDELIAMFTTGDASSIPLAIRAHFMMVKKGVTAYNTFKSARMLGA